jgi:hypothetical protein
MSGFIACPITVLLLAQSARPLCRTWTSIERLGVAGWNDCRGFDHEDNRPIRCSRPMQDAFRNDITLPGLKVDRFAFQVDDEVTVKDKEELVVIVVLVPVVFTLHDAQADDGLVDLTKCLVVPVVGASIHKRRYVDDGEGRELDVEVRRVGCTWLSPIGASVGCGGMLGASMSACNHPCFAHGNDFLPAPARAARARW